MKRKIIYKIIAGLLIYFILNTCYKLYKNYTISETCLSNTFNNKYLDLSNLKINSIHNFDEIFNCQEWDEIFVTSSIYYYRGIGYLYTGVLVPSYDKFQYPEGTALLYFMKNNAIISNPLPLYSDNFIFSNHYGKSNSVRIKRKHAKFIYKKHEHTDFELNTLELINDYD
ncbi:hypothetical protein DS884_00115 [Tenacibaculum sp. E3R01]|uniref:hypothetical protein n=1 Tax=Tenacibaculum sp. E3R01 TaxID=2267227 RepID=UPI000DE9BEB3|nr:hypothetical protein [Tenacibaculum sp. E3R01]RBW63428.1 hypothetical protein DS884_00115 [Tenacibaculum sp. E3R01]